VFCAEVGSVLITADDRCEERKGRKRRREIPMLFSRQVYCACNMRHLSAMLWILSGSVPDGSCAASAFEIGFASSMVNRSMQRIGDILKGIRGGMEYYLKLDF